MTAPDSDESGAGDDVLELGETPNAGAPVAASAALPLAAVALLAGPVATGYTAGARHAADHAPPHPHSRAAALAAPFSAGGFPLSQSGPQCSVQTGRELQVGLQITNLYQQRSSSAGLRLCSRSAASG